MLAGEIDLPQITPEEVAVLRAGPGVLQDYVASGMTFDAALQDLRVTLLRRTDGRYFLRLDGKRPVTSDSLDLIMQAQAAGNSVWRDYTVVVRKPEPANQTLALGLARVLSRRGEPLRAEIDMPLTPSGAAPRATVASPAEFAAAAIPYNPALGDVQIRAQRRPDGRSFLSVTTDKPFEAPTLDLVMDASWSSGRIVRDYSMTLQPEAVAAVTAPAQRVSSGAVTPEVAATPPIPTPVEFAPQVQAAAPAVAPPATAPTVAPPAPAPAPVLASAAPPASGDAIRSEPAPAVTGAQVQVKPGDTASRLALAHKPMEISLDQMLVAMLQANPSAFAGGNVNRLRSGAVLVMPTAAQAGAVSAEEAVRVLSLQSRDFDDFRRRMAGMTYAATPGEAAGVKTTLVSKPVVRSRLALSMGGLAGMKDPVHITQQLEQQAARAAQLTKQIEAMAATQGARPAPVAVAPARSPASSAVPPVVPASARKTG